MFIELAAFTVMCCLWLLSHCSPGGMAPKAQTASCLTLPRGSLLTLGAEDTWIIFTFRIRVAENSHFFGIYYLMSFVSLQNPVCHPFSYGFRFTSSALFSPLGTPVTCSLHLLTVSLRPPGEKSPQIPALFSGFTSSPGSWSPSSSLFC